MLISAVQPCRLTAHAPSTVAACSARGVFIGAVTNGCGDPLKTPGLAPLFDFCVSAEDEDVFPQRKPSRRPFDKALAFAALLKRTGGGGAGSDGDAGSSSSAVSSSGAGSELEGGAEGSSSESEVEDDDGASQAVTRPAVTWIHVGKDLVQVR